MRLGYHCAPVVYRTKVMVQQSQIKRRVSIRSPGEVDVRCSSEINSLDMVNISFTSRLPGATDAPLSPSPEDNQTYQPIQERRRHGGTRWRLRHVPTVCHLHYHYSDRHLQICRGISYKREIASSLVRGCMCGHPTDPSSREGVSLFDFD